MVNRICLIVCYFGTFPDMFEVWVQSCKKNPEFDFFIFTDQVDNFLQIREEKPQHLCTVSAVFE